jgi:hypothetical protein
VKVTKTNAKHAHKPAKRASSETVKATSGRKVIAAVAAEAAKYRPDLKVRASSSRWLQCSGCGKTPTRVTDLEPRTLLSTAA